MKKLVVITIALLFSFAVILNAQSSSKKEKKEYWKVEKDSTTNYYDEEESVKFPVSSIKIIADAEDVIFLQAAVREELIRAGKVNIIDCGDTLQVNLVVQYNDKEKSNGRNGKWGEILLTVVSNNGLVGSTARSFLESWDHGSYYKKLQDLTIELVKKFQFQ